MEEILFSYLADYIKLTEEDKHIISGLLLIREYKKGHILLEQGKKTKDSYLVVRGCVRSYYMVDGEEKTTEFYTELDVVAPVCAADDKPSQYYLSCVEDTALLVSNPQLEAAGFEQFPAFEMLCRVMSEKESAKKQSALDLFKILNPEQRYLHLLQSRPLLFQRVPQHQLASYLGITPQSLSRLRKRLVSK